MEQNQAKRFWDPTAFGVSNMDRFSGTSGAGQASKTHSLRANETGVFYIKIFGKCPRTVTAEGKRKQTFL